MSRYDELEMASLVDAIDRAYEDTRTLDALHVEDIFREMGHLLDLLQEPLAAERVRRLAGDACVLENNTDSKDLLSSRIDDVLEMLDMEQLKADGDEIGEWLTEHRGRSLFLVPKDLEVEDVERALEEYAKASEDPA